MFSGGTWTEHWCQRKSTNSTLQDERARPAEMNSFRGEFQGLLPKNLFFKEHLQMVPSKELILSLNNLNLP